MHAFSVLHVSHAPSRRHTSRDEFVASDVRGLWVALSGRCRFKHHFTVILLQYSMTRGTLAAVDVSASIASACASFRALTDPKETSSFEVLIQLPLSTPADVTALLTVIAEVCEAHDGNRVTAGPAVVHRICGCLRDGLVMDASTATAWCRALLWLCGGTSAAICVDNIAAFASGGGLPLMMKLIDLYVAEERVCTWACSALALLARDEDGMEPFVPGGGLESLFAAMGAHLGSAHVQEAACVSLCYLSDGDQSMVSKGALDRLFAAMAAHQASATVLTEACCVLRNLAVDEGSGAAMVSAGGLDHLLTAMSAHPMCADLQDAALGTMFNLSFTRVNVRPLRAVGVTGLIRAAMALHPYDNGVQEVGTQLLSCLDQD